MECMIRQFDDEPVHGRVVAYGDGNFAFVMPVSLDGEISEPGSAAKRTHLAMIYLYDATLLTMIKSAYDVQDTERMSRLWKRAILFRHRI